MGPSVQEGSLHFVHSFVMFPVGIVFHVGLWSFLLALVYSCLGRVLVTKLRWQGVHSGGGVMCHRGQEEFMCVCPAGFMGYWRGVSLGGLVMIPGPPWCGGGDGCWDWWICAP